MKQLILKLALGISILGVVSCSKEEAPAIELNTDLEVSNKVTRYLFGSEVEVSSKGDGTYVLGDMVLFEDNFDGDFPNVNPSPQPPNVGGLTIGRGYVRKWPNNTIVYRLDSSINGSVLEEWNKAINEWTTKTSIKFKEQTNEDAYVTVSSNGQACNCGVATLGVNRDRGFIRLGSRTSVGVIVHEIGHTLGFIHEQNRADRDQYVNVLFENISDGAENQFFISQNAEPLTDQLDVRSTMMYGSFTFSKNGRPTIVDLSGNTLPRNSGLLSSGDIEATLQAYPGSVGGGDDNTEEEEQGEEEKDENEEDNNPNPAPSNSCDDLEEWSSNTVYQVGDRVVFRGYIFERDFSRWNLIKKCDSVVENPCEGVPNYNRLITYTIGDRVVFRNYVYRRVANGWIREAQCN